MISEMNIGGVFFTPLVLWAIIALALNFLLRKLFTLLGVYRIVWHTALFDFATFIILWATMSAVSLQYPLICARMR